MIPSLKLNRSCQSKLIWLDMIKGHAMMLIEWTYLMSIAIHRVDVPFSEIRLTRGNRALPLSLVILSIKIQDETITVGPMLLFQRISICKMSDKDLVEFLK
uniref:Uncharacterized protein n=1 Tax=Cacopsylla melanoneura TaxID=428564 RepID=A0A8D9AV72_9HEMI